MAGSFVAPVVEDAPSHPTWVLLDMNPYKNAYGWTCFDDGDNATTAYAVTSAGRTVQVTFRLAAPPSVSRFCFHDIKNGARAYEAYYDRVEAELISSAKDLVLFRSSSPQQPELYKYFVYQAACYRRNSLPTLKLIPTIHAGMSYPGILSCDDDEGEFFLADLSPTPDPGHYVLDVFSSKTNKWVTWPLQLQSPRPSVCTEHLPPQKVMALGGGAVGWIDLWRGILVCNVLEEHPALRFIPLPKPGIDLRQVGELGDPRMIRDVTCCDGIIKFIEIDCRFKEVPRTDINANKTMYDDLDGEGVIYDSELLLEKGDPSCPAQYYIIPDGWKIRKCYRHISWDYWRKGHAVDSDDVEIDNTRCSMGLPQPMNYNTHRWTMKDLTTVAYYPTLSARDDDVVYLRSRNIWMVGVDLGKNTVEVAEEINVDRFQHPRLLSCAFSKI